MKILTVIGARPQFIKASVVSNNINKKSQDGCNIEEIIVHTGQHFDKDMSEVFFDDLNIPLPKYNLGVNNLSHAKMTAEMMGKLDDIITIEKPDTTLVFGDTNSTLAASLVSAKHHVPIAHVESGLRSYNRRMPEEINRILTDHISKYLFCPNENSVCNLEKEGIINSHSTLVQNVGDVMFDLAKLVSERHRLDNNKSNEKYIE